MWNDRTVNPSGNPKLLEDVRKLPDGTSHCLGWKMLEKNPAAGPPLKIPGDVSAVLQSFSDGEASWRERWEKLERRGGRVKWVMWVMWYPLVNYPRYPWLSIGVQMVLISMAHLVWFSYLEGSEHSIGGVLAGYRVYQYTVTPIWICLTIVSHMLDGSVNTTGLEKRLVKIEREMHQGFSHVFFQQK